jgi:TRAP-type C4-dicarboxylate transport system substrate-binding protein
MKRIAALLLAIALGLIPASCDAAHGGTEADSDAAVSADAQTSSGTKVYELIVQNHDPASSICGQYVEAWGRTVEDASGGRIKFIYHHGGSLVGADDSVNAVLNGTADICWSAASIYSGQFPISEFIQLPLSGITCARMGCDIMQDMLREIPAFAAEYAAFKVIMLGSCTYAPVSTTIRKLETVNDIRGLRIRAPGSTCALWCSSVDMSPMTVATPETNGLLENGVIEGCLNDWHNISAAGFTKILITSWIIRRPALPSSC